MAKKSRWDRVVKGMTLEEVKKLFGEDISQHDAFGPNVWVVGNEADPSPDHAYLITLYKNGKVKHKDSISFAG